MSTLTKDLKTYDAHKQLYESHIKEKLINRKIRDDSENKISIGNTKLVELKDQKNEGLKRSEELKTQITKLENIMIAITKNEADLGNLRKQLQLIRVEPYSGTEQELEQEIAEAQHGSGGRNFAEERVSIERKLVRNNQERQELAKSKAGIEGKISSLKAVSIHRESLKNELSKLESALCLELSLTDPLDNETVGNAMRSKVSEMTKKTQHIVADSAGIQKELRSAQETVTKIEVELRTLNSEKLKLDREVEALKLKIKQGENASAGMKDLLKKEEDIRKQLDMLPELDENALNINKRKREAAQKELDQLKKQCMEAEKNSEKEKEMETLKQSLSISRKKATAYDRRHKQNLEELFESGASAPWTPALSKLCVKLRNERKIIEEDLKKVQLDVQKSETMQQQQRKYEEKLTAQELQLNEDIFDNCTCEPEEVSKKLSDLRVKLKKARKELSPISAKVDLYDTWIESTNSSGCCPLCDRDFSSKKEISEFSKRLQNLTLNFPAEQEQLEKSVLKMELEEGKLVKADAQATQLLKIQNELSEIRQKSKTAMRELKEEKKSLVQKEEQLEEMNEKMKVVEELQADVGVMDQLWEQIQENERKVKRLEEEISSNSDEKTTQTYVELREEAEQKEKEYRKIVHSGDELQKCAHERNQLQSKLNELGSHRVSLGEAAAQTGAFAEQFEKKKQEIEKCLKETEQKQEEDLPEAKFRREELTSTAAKKEDERKRAEMEMQLTKKELEQKHDQWQTLVKNVQEGGKCEQRLTEQEENRVIVNDQLEENQQRQKRFEEDLRMLNGSQNKQLVLEDQRQRMRIEKKMKSVEAMIEKLVDQGVDEEQISRLKMENTAILNEVRNAGIEEVRIDTQIREYDNQLQTAEKRLATKEAQRAEENYRDAILNLALYQESINDLTKYQKCLENSLMFFHKEKMAAVNVIIDELWRKVYNSTDITTIRIRSDNKAEGSTVRKGASYDYNVMMVQESGAEVEMRGRCSAGQKMLASLLIRIALAEVFGGLCSMIALDEPTTNLDESKVDGMAGVLNDLIEARRGYDENGVLRGREMQMVVITHDERLVNKLTIGCRPEYIYCLGKDEHGVSFLSKRLPDGREIRVTGSRSSKF
uniref:Zinc-hook domain-containing protein n=1 Tax=Caenorhabditis japonica TaxID=281687 RepID=A0A8R1DUJ2_CAEJA